jgi:hypothetical protein
MILQLVRKCLSELIIKPVDLSLAIQIYKFYSFPYAFEGRFNAIRDDTRIYHIQFLPMCLETGAIPSSYLPDWYYFWSYIYIYIYIYHILILIKSLFLKDEKTLNIRDRTETGDLNFRLSEIKGMVLAYSWHMWLKSERNIIPKP